MNFQSWPLGRVMGALSALQIAGALKPTTKNNRILLDLAKFAEDKHFLTPRQLSFARNLLPGYADVIAKLAIPVVSPVRKEEQSGGRPACSFSIFNPKTIKIDAPLGSPLLRMARRIAGFRALESGTWRVPFSARNVYALLHAGFAMGSRVQEILDRSVERPQMPDFSPIKMPLKDYQKQGVARLLGMETGGILADEQGLGKTAQAIAWAELSGFSKICVVCPASLKANWRREIEQWTGQTNCCILAGKTQTKEQAQALTEGRWIIINYDILAAWVPALSSVGVQAFIFDEAQALKNEQSKRTKAAQKIAKGRKTLMLSGTPCENRPAEFFPIIRMIDALLFPSKTKFYERYCDLHLNSAGFMDHSGASNTQELHKILSDTIMIRRKKKEVLAELPDKQRALVPVLLPISALREYVNAEKDFVSWLTQNKPKKGAARKKQLKAQAMIKIDVLKRIAALAKLPMIIDWIKTYLENEQKLVVFASHKDVIRALAQEFGESAVVVDGSVPAEKRQALCDAFQNDSKVKLFIGNIKAAGTGLTLTAAKDTLTVEFAWTATAHDQCEDRVHRIGQKNAVMAYYILAEGTIEEKIIRMLDSKRAIITQVLDGRDPVDEDLLDELLNQYEGLKWK